MANTLLLDTVAWDLVIDADGDIAVAEEPYALAQDAAASIRLFAGELWWDTTLGAPYFDQVLGKFPPLATLKAMIISQALLVPDVVGAQCYITSVAGGVVSGQVQVTDVAGQIAVASF